MHLSTPTSVPATGGTVAVAPATDSVRHNADYGDNIRLITGNRASQHPWSDAGGDLSDAVATEYLAGYAGHTHAAYRRDLTDFFTHCRRTGVAPLAASRGDLAGYLHFLRTTGRRPATVARRLVTLRGFYDLAVTEYGLHHSPAARIRMRRPRSQARIHALTLSTLGSFLTAADHATPRTTGLAWLLASTGIRITEACTARVDDISETSGEPWLIVTCKGNLRRSVPLHPATWARLQPLLAEGTGPLFVTRTGRHLDRQAGARDLGAVATTAGISTRFSPHVLRHTFVTLARQTGCSLEDVQDAAGHADPATTRAYDRTRQTHADHPAHRILIALTTGTASTVAVAGSTADVFSGRAAS